MIVKTHVAAKQQALADHHGRMVENSHLDPNFFAVFVEESVYIEYAREYLANDQFDTVDIASLPRLRATSSA
ncbi:hypothetical protein [Halomonas llamarensis]|uniref:Uncharacterized protein n=1 Tax=Halomonas llamarensis TaxID=2945104 RepID=A0ABT0SPG3_9GAMM|nr:hypothetical protein [Halomonas llamarensis]MCL7929672.1 hypothetical protein [Halomonas llamarensis]